MKKKYYMETMEEMCNNSSSVSIQSSVNTEGNTIWKVKHSGDIQSAPNSWNERSNIFKFWRKLKMKKVYVVLLIMVLISSCFGCQNKQLTNDTITENVNENNMDEDEQNSNNTDFVLNCDDATSDFTFNNDTIANLSKVTEMFDWSNVRELTCDYEVEIQLEDDSVPEEIIEVLISVNDRDDTNDELYKNYLSANYISIDLETVTNTELGNSIYYDLKK